MHILLVDDEADSRHFVANFLKKFGYSVTEAGDGLEALHLIEEQDFGLVLTDIRMPGISGIEMLRELRKLPHKRHTYSVVFTAFGDVQSAVDALRLDAYDYLFKPIDARDLLNLVQKIEGHLQENENIANRAVEMPPLKPQNTSSENHSYINIMGIGQAGVFSDSMKQIFQQARVLHSAREIPVLINGETGTGKELVARYIHCLEGDGCAPFIDVNCSALLPTLFESELFGYEPGSFTGGAAGGRKGKFDLANGGTLFLDEISEIPIELQAKLLRVLQEKEFFRVGGLQKVKCDVRIICATNVDIEKRINQGLFRRDLYHRLSAGHVRIPSLKERKDDIIPLAEMFMRTVSAEKGKRFVSISRTAKDMLAAYNWPGNVRELRNVIEWAVLFHNDDEIKADHLKIKTNEHPAVDEKLGIFELDKLELPAEGLELEKLTDAIVLKALEMNGGNKTKTAHYLGMSVRALSYRLKQLGQ
ncbi:MAG: sigma-54-dependent transcriptional regulator [Candidatus Saccharibacteria bacterium]